MYKASIKNQTKKQPVDPMTQLDSESEIVSSRTLTVTEKILAIIGEDDDDDEDEN